MFLTPQTTYQKAANAELSRDFDKAFKLYLKSAELYLHLSRQSTEDRLRALCKAEAAKALERAEKIKSVRQDIRPVAKDEFSDSKHLSAAYWLVGVTLRLSAQQLYVLQKSSLVNQGFFPLWDSPDKPSPSLQSVCPPSVY